MSVKTLAKIGDLHKQRYREVMRQVNEVAQHCGLQEYTTYSRLWEYPWAWSQLELLKGRGLQVLDVGSGRSAFPWFLAIQGFRVIVSDTRVDYWRLWGKANHRIKSIIKRQLLDVESLDLPTDSVDIYLSISVIEHVPNKAKAIQEAARVLRPGGLLVMTFDVCEPNMGMSFPRWNGRALAMHEFDVLFENNPWFESGLAELPWNTDDIPDYLAWHQTTAPHHNYVTGAAIIHRNCREWKELHWKNLERQIRGTARTYLPVGRWYLKHGTRALLSKAMSTLTSPQAAWLFGEPLFWLMGRRRKRRQIDLSQVKRVLVVRLDEIGDVVMTSPYLRELRRLLPDVWITLVVKPTIYNLVELCPYANEVLTYEWKVKGRLGTLRRHLGAFCLAQKRLWRRRFDLAILPRWDADYYNGTFLAYFSGAPWRVGYSENVITHKKRWNTGFNRLLTHSLEDSNIKHEVEHNLDVIRLIGGEVHDSQLELWLSPEDDRFIDELLRDHRVISSDLLIGLVPGAGAPKREWPISSFAELGLWLHKTYNAKVLLVGGPGEETLGEELQQRLSYSAINIIGQTTLRQTVALLKRCKLYIGNDVGPMHMAAAVGVPVVELSCHPKNGRPLSPNSPLRFGPWRVEHTILQPKTPLWPCSEECIANQPHCILGITAEQVKEALVRQLQKQKVDT